MVILDIVIGVKHVDINGYLMNCNFDQLVMPQGVNFPSLMYIFCP